MRVEDIQVIHELIVNPPVYKVTQESHTMQIQQNFF